MLLLNVLDDPIGFALLAVSLIICISIHEFSHAYVAHRLGDDTAKFLGRVTLNPAAHLDPIGTLTLLLVGFGWGKPVPFNPYNLKNPKRDSALIALAGPLSNFVLAVLFALVFHLVFGTVGGLFAKLVYMIVYYNLILGIFNLIPIHPLDGFKIVNGVLPYNLSIQWMQIAPYGVFILVAFLFTGVVRMILIPVISFFLIILGLPTL
jgi:Zn-dependent protease